jgi:hypothetical protein
MKSVMIHQFSNVPEANIQRSLFQRDFGYKTTLDAGKLVPFFCDMCYPGDTYLAEVSMFGRMATPIYPIMDNIRVETFYFSVPLRLVWNDFKIFMGETSGPNDTRKSEDFLIPQLTSDNSANFKAQSLWDYLGFPQGISGLSVSALPFRAYCLVWQEWFRAEFLQDAPTLNLTSTSGYFTGNSNQLEESGWDNLYMPAPRGKRFDYFTGCLPFPQYGEGVQLPLGVQGDVTISSNGKQIQLVSGGVTGGLITGNFDTDPVRYSPVGIPMPGAAVENQSVQFGSETGLTGVADLTSATAITINSLRQAFAMQHFLERLAIGGARYTEIIRSMFGVISPDARLQRPEFLGHGVTNLNINPVQQTAESADGGSPLGNLAAYAYFSDIHHAFNYSATEHCILLGLMSITADLTYQQGIDRQWSYRTREELYWPQFAHLGEQAVLNKEIFAQGNDDDDEVFGYQERYAEMRYYPSKITGKLNSNYRDSDSASSNSLSAWHLAQYFTQLPVLNGEFIIDNPPIERVIAVPSEPQFIVDIYVKLQCYRPMPLYGTPGLTRM